MVSQENAATPGDGVTLTNVEYPQKRIRIGYEFPINVSIKNNLNTTVHGIAISFLVNDRLVQKVSQVSLGPYEARNITFFYCIKSAVRVFTFALDNGITINESLRVPGPRNPNAIQDEIVQFASGLLLLSGVAFPFAMIIIGLNGLNRKE